MKVKWFEFTAANDGFDVIVRDQGASNGPVLAEVGVRGKAFEQFVEEVLFEGMKTIKKSEPKKATEKDWHDEPKGVPDETPPTEDAETDEKKSWFGN